MNAMPLKSVGNGSVLVADVGHAEDSGALQYNIVRIDGQRSVYVPIFKQGGNSNTITIVNGMKNAIKKLVDIPRNSKPRSSSTSPSSLSSHSNSSSMRPSSVWFSPAS